MWKKYFKVVGIVPGPVIVYDFGTVDFSREDLPVELCKKLYEADCRYLDITAEGKKELYGLKTETAAEKKTAPRQRNKRKQN